MAFEQLSDKLQAVMKKVRGQSRLTEENMEEMHIYKIQIVKGIDIPIIRNKDRWNPNLFPEKAKIEEQVAERKEAKDNKDWAKADEIRDSLKEQGIILFDTKETTTWGIDELYNI